MSGWRMSVRGYLSQAEVAYALALYAYARNERKPPWATHLRKDVRALFDVELEELIANDGVRPAEPLNNGEPDAAKMCQPIAPVAYRESISSELDDAELDAFDDESADPTGDSNVDAIFTTGVQLAASGEHEKAVEAFTMVLESNPDDAEAWHFRAKSQLGCAHFNEAIRDCTESLRIEPGEHAVACTRAAAYIWSRRFSEALPDLDAAISADRKQPHPWYLRGLAHIGLNKFDRALDDLNKAIRYAPTWSDNYLARSRAYAAIGENERADADLKEAIRRDPSLADESARSRRLASQR